MNAECEVRKGTKIIRIKNDIGLKDDIGDLIGLVKEALQTGIANIALCFTQSSYFNTRSVSVLVQCHEILDEKGGHLSIVAPNPDLLDVLRTIGLECSIAVFESESAIAG